MPLGPLPPACAPVRRGGARRRLALVLALAVGLPLLAVPPLRADGGGAAPAPPAPVVLGPEQRQLRAQSLAAVGADPDAWVARYLRHVTEERDGSGRVIRPGTADLAEAMARGPLLISPDDAKELFPAYAADTASRSLHSESVHEASGLIAETVWRRALRQPSPPGREAVLLLGGGVASGKTTALRTNAGVRQLMGRVALVRESTLASPGRSAAHIAAARAAGRPVQVLYVYAPVELAVQRLVDRGMRIGRGVAAPAVARSHWLSQRTVLELADRYRGDPAVRFAVVFSEPGGRGALLPIDELRRRRWDADPRFPDWPAFRRYVEQLVRRELEQRRLDPLPADPSPELRRTLQGDG